MEALGLSRAPNLPRFGGRHLFVPPRVLPQALIAGKPVVSYDVDGAREVVVSGETGFLIPPRDIEELADKLTLLAGDSALRDRLGGEGRRRFTEQFRHKHMTAQLRTLYQDILCKAATSGRGAVDDDDEADRIWTKTFSESEDILGKLADEAAGEKSRGKTDPLDVDRL